jgi:general secretion pathway protein E
MDPISAEAQAFQGRDSWETTLGNQLLERASISRQALSQTRRIQASSDERLGILLVRLGVVAERELAETLVEMSGASLVRANEFPALALYENELSANYLREAMLLPITETDQALVVAMADPGDEFAREALETLCAKPVQVRVGYISEIRAAVDRLYGRAEPADAGPALGDLDDADIEQLKDMASEAPVVRFVNGLIDRAVQQAASDIHIEPFEQRLKVRYRIDGVLQDVPIQAPGPAAAVVSRVKLIAKLNIAERRLPQDGRIQVPVQGKSIDMRVSTVPTLHGESVVLRILDREQIRLDFEVLGFSGTTLERLKQTLALAHGILLVTGPTGSGKSTTLYTALQTLNTPGRKLITVEDPVEYQIEGVNQIQVKPQIGLDFANALRSIMRQDPDVIMIGEMRDTETARIAVQSALTGHVVLSTMHTNDAGSSITRLLDMGVEDYLVTSTVNAVLAQRLVRRLCGQCKRAHAVDGEFLSEWRSRGLAPNDEPEQLFESSGCESCGGSGYRGRLAISEFMAMTDTVRQLILEQTDSTAIQRAAVADGMDILLVDGLKKTAAGLTSFEEVVRVTQDV